MCRVDYCDDDGEWLEAPTERAARKNHTCGDCGRIITKGERYTHGKYVQDGSMTTVKMCAHCIAAGGWLDKVCHGHLYPGVVEELEEHYRDEPSLRTTGLLWLIAAANRDWQRRGQLIPVADVRRHVKAALAKIPAEAH